MIRGLGILSILLSLVVLGILAAIGHTAFLLTENSEVGELSFEFADNKADLSAPLTVVNEGFLDISSFSLNAKATLSDGSTLGETTIGPITIASGQSISLTPTFTIDFSSLSPQALNSLLYEDGTIDLIGDVSISIASLIGLDASFKQPLPWGAPLGNLRFGDSVVTNHNSTHVLVSVPLSFENGSPYFDIDGIISATIFNATSNTLVGSGQLNVIAPSGTSFSSEIQTFLRLDSNTRASLAFQDKTLEFRVDLAIEFAGATINRSEPLSYEWGAPLSGLTIGTPDITPDSSSSLGISIPFEFTNNSPERLSFTLNAEIFNATSGQRLGETTTPVSVESKSKFSGTIDGILVIGRSNMVSLSTKHTTLSFEAKFSTSLDGAPIGFTRTFETEWGAPLQNLNFGEATIGQSENLTHVGLTVPIGFTNNSPFVELTGTIQVDFFDSLGDFAGSATVPLSVPPNTDFNGVLRGAVLTASTDFGPFKAIIKI
ncbi:MAG: hypothetical protein QQN63_10070, partial [Nitrosopumilus sp.]